jgi:sporulation protein YlmC with PRC-barrel domain
MKPNTLSASSLEGTNVYNNSGQELGDIKEIMIDLDNGRIAYAVLSFGGFLGLGDKYFAIPWDSMSFDTVNERIILNVSKEKLENAPGFDKDHWPDTADTKFLENVYTYYETEPFWKRRRAA